MNDKPSQKGHDYVVTRFKFWRPHPYLRNGWS